VRAKEILRQFQADLRGVHLARARCVFAVVHTLLRSGRLSLTSLGRAIADRTSPKHGIKRVDRLLGNPRLHAERLTFYRAIARKVIGRSRHPVIMVDWTSVTPEIWALVAAVAFEGRALTVYGESHPITRYAKPGVNAHFLRRLKAVVPATCTPIIVTDAGFRTPWMKLVERMGWDYVGRIRHGTVQNVKRKQWSGFAPLWRRTRLVPTDLGRAEVGLKARHACRLVGIRKRGAYLAPVPTVVFGSRASGNYDRGVKRYRRHALEPWTLATSLNGTPDEVVRIYRQRMQIEETFRDAKSPRFGIAMSYARTSSTERADVLLLLASLGHLVSVLIGIAAEAAGLNLRYQANTVKARRVLSLAALGRLVAASDAVPLTRALLNAAWARVRSPLCPCPEP
jgi:hypothetical protein